MGLSNSGHQQLCRGQAWAQTGKWEVETKSVVASRLCSTHTDPKKPSIQFSYAVPLEDTWEDAVGQSEQHSLERNF